MTDEEIIEKLRKIKCGIPEMTTDQIAEAKNYADELYDNCNNSTRVRVEASGKSCCLTRAVDNIATIVA